MTHTLSAATLVSAIELIDASMLNFISGGVAATDNPMLLRRDDRTDPEGGVGLVGGSVG